MAQPLKFYLDFASPYSWFALDAVERIGARHGRAVDWRVLPVWALMKAQGVGFPLDVPARRAYMLHDMIRSGQFHGVPYRQPSVFPANPMPGIRLYHALAARDAGLARRFGRRMFEGYFVEDRDISDPAAVAEIAGSVGVSPEDAAAGMASPQAKRAVFDTVAEAQADGACGLPYVLADGEGFFGADRLDQLDWRLAQTAKGAQA